VIKEGHEEEDRRSPPAELQSLFQKQPVDINPKKLQWSKYTQEQAQRGGRIGGPASFAAQSKAAPTDSDYLMADGTKPKNQGKQTQSSGGRTDAKPEVKEVKKFHPNPENEDDLNTKWQEATQRRWLQRRQELERTGEENTVQRIEEQLQLGPAAGFLEGLGAGALGYNLGYVHRRSECRSRHEGNRTI
jgi:hypothetical protein